MYLKERSLLSTSCSPNPSHPTPDSVNGKLKFRAGKGLAPYYTSFLVADQDRLSLNVHM